MKTKATIVGLSPLLAALLITLLITITSCKAGGYCSSWNNPSASTLENKIDEG